MSTAPSDLSAATIIPLIEAGSYAREVVLNVARGFLPLEQDDLVAVLAYLCGSPDGEIAAAAHASLADLPPRTLLTFASNPEIPPAHLESLLRATADHAVLEMLIRNRAVSDAAVAELARRAEPPVQDVIVINQARILRSPGILDALLANPNVSPDVRRRALETREEFFEKKARMEAVLKAAAAATPDEEPLADEPLDAIADLLQKADEQEPGEARPPAPPPVETERDDHSRAIWSQLQFMSVSEKVQLAFKGNRTLRMLLVRERNKLICTAVIRNPRMSETEVEAIAGMRNVEEEVLRMIGARRDWMGKYNIMLTLCRNPKAPVGVVLPLINRLTLRDLKGLKDDKNVPQVVRETAKRLYQSKTQKQTG
ncbi:MAG TPA: hypothetical protein VNL91_02585 [Thermoanaerobaculia bacterium]|nr:hypothetical protein [Thermoanaerobaculia bacterium]